MTVHTYSPGGELDETTDARGVTTLRTHDALDRLVSVDLPGEAFDTAYTYDDPATPFSLGHLSAITRGAGTPQATEVPYAYDRFGRTVRDGALTFTHDAHGNPIETRHELASGARVTLATGYDFADRPVSAAVTVDDGVSAPTATDLVTGAAYAPGGPLTELVRGNGLTETRSRDGRYRLTRIEATAGAPATSPGPRLDWSHTWDPVGNLLTVTDALGGSPRTYGYQDIAYYLLQGDGPWGTRSWSYDRIGNRLEASSQGAPADVYHYAPNGAGGNTPQLASIDLGAGGTRSFTFGPAGHLKEISGAGAPDPVLLQHFETGADSRHIAFDPDTGTAAAPGAATERVDWTYDGRSFLASSSPATLFQDGFESGGTTCWNEPAGSPGCTTPAETLPVYTSEGLLRCLERPTGTQVFLYFAGQPLAQLTLPPGGAPELLHLTTDHLGTPVLATDAAGALVWQGGFEPFGADWSGAAVAGMPLRLPGQWWDETWGNAAAEAVFYNVHRWYGAGTGRYSRTDPLGRNGDLHPYLYAMANPVTSLDPLGLKVRVCCKAIPATLYGSVAINTRYGSRAEYKRHCYFEFGDGSTVGLHGPTDTLGVLGAIGCQARSEIQRRQRGQGGFDQRADLPTGCGPWAECADDCVNEAVGNYPNPARYCLLGPNSNSFAGSIERKCPVKPPPASEIRNAPGWYDGPPN